MTAEQETRLYHFTDVIRQTNRIAATTELDALLDQMLDLIICITQAQAGTLYLYDTECNELVFKVVKGEAVTSTLLGQRFAADRGIAGAVLQHRQALFVPDVAHDPRWDHRLAQLLTINLKTIYAMPLMLHDQPVGVIQLFNLPYATIHDPDELTILQLLGDRLATEIEKARLLAEAHRREQRQQALIDINSYLITTLERDKILNRILEYVSQLLDVEAASIWLRDDQTGELVLQTATGSRISALREVRVPPDQGIIGYVTRTGERVLVQEAQHDQRFYRQIDQESGFVTRSILCVPMRARAIHLGLDQGHLAETIIGGAQALNKRNRQPFNAEDISLFEALACQAATALQLARLYERNSRLFLGMIQAVTSAIDLKDPYTRGHSQRVAEFAVAIAQEMELSPEIMYHVRIGGILHDVGKIGVSDHILRKPGSLTPGEMREMRMHPEYGVRLLEDAGLTELLLTERSALAQHHERLDGSGYPYGLKGEQITLIGRIVAVADAFDAMTSDRPYRPGMPVQKALHILRNASDTEYDARCVEALIRAHSHGLIRTQHERDKA